MFRAMCCRRAALARREVGMSWEGVYARHTCVWVFHVVMCRIGRVRVSCVGRVGEVGDMSCSRKRAGWAVIRILSMWGKLLCVVGVAGECGWG
jgi:hypothetical protein